jgi:hypothetical protein
MTAPREVGMSVVRRANAAKGQDMNTISARSRFVLSLTVMAIAALGAARLATAGAAKPVWLCKPGIADNPCEPGMETTTVSPAAPAGG